MPVVRSGVRSEDVWCRWCCEVRSSSSPQFFISSSSSLQRPHPAGDAPTNAAVPPVSADSMDKAKREELRR